ncbi:hypothetical protein DL93DRAFT_346476 [Clavulina sp. PMI_390]|nr:hypothetical protein DL93DRAFT_346476 [Clavulina sp. PMI_390]
MLLAHNRVELAGSLTRRNCNHHREEKKLLVILHAGKRGIYRPEDARSDGESIQRNTPTTRLSSVHGRAHRSFFDRMKYCPAPAHKEPLQCNPCADHQCHNQFSHRVARKRIETSEKKIDHRALQLYRIVIQTKLGAQRTGYLSFRYQRPAG